MIRGDILRTKSVQASADHEREVRSLGVIREREREARERVRGREERFWREIARASASRTPGVTPQTGGDSSSLTRALEAHRLLKEARSAHQNVTHDVRAQVDRVIRSKVAANAFATLQMKERLKHENRLAERSGEEVGEIGTSAKFLRARRGGDDRERGQRMDPLSFREAPRVMPVTIPVLLAPSFQPTDGQVPDRGWSMRVSLRPGCFMPSDLVVTTAQINTAEHSSSLQVRVESKGVPLACHLTTKSLGKIGVVVEAPHGGLLQSFERERVSLIAKLTGLGIKVSSIEVRRDTQGSGAAGGNLYRVRKRTGDDDENSIA